MSSCLSMLPLTRRISNSFSMALGRCKLSGELGTFAKAHVIPKAFFITDGSVRRITSDQSDRPRRAPIGLYDSRLVVRKTEQWLATLDDYGVRFMRGQIGNARGIYRGGELLAYEVQGLDYARLKLFFLSVLWRCGASGRPELSAFSLGDEQERLRQMIVNEDPGTANDFAVVMVKYSVADPVVPVTTPVREEREGLNFARATFGSARILWKVEPAELTGPMREIALCPTKPWVVGAHNWYESDDRKTAQELLRDTEAKYGTFWTG